jgi:hypothetical protein
MIGRANPFLNQPQKRWQQATPPQKQAKECPQQVSEPLKQVKQR